jgi:hypothetical protein
VRFQQYRDFNILVQWIVGFQPVQRRHNPLQMGITTSSIEFNLVAKEALRV